MKKVWENPELNGLGVSATNEGGTIARYDIIATSDMEGRKQWVCLGIFDMITHEPIESCGQVFESYQAWYTHADIHAADAKQGEGIGATPLIS